MNHVPETLNPAPRPATADLRATLLTWGPIVAGLGFMYGPSFVDLFRGIWSTDEQAHGPIVLGVSCWLVWRNWPAMWARSEGAQTSSAGWPVFVIAAPTPTAHRHRMELLQAWIALPADELMADWELAASGETPYKIEPLR